MKAPATLVLSLLFLVSFPLFSRAESDVCFSCLFTKKDPGKTVQKAHDALEQFLFSTFSGTLSGCPAAHPRVLNDEKSGLAVSLIRKNIHSPDDCQPSNTQAARPPDVTGPAGTGANHLCIRFQSVVGSSWKAASSEIPPGQSRALCQIEFKHGCGDSHVSRIEKLEWMASQLRFLNTSLCREATEQFYQACGLWNDKDYNGRRNELLSKVATLIGDFQPKSGQPLLPAPKEPRGRQPPLLVKSHLLTPSLAQCLFHREDPDFTPNRLNPTECMGRLRLSRRSSASGLVMVVRSTAQSLWKANLLQGYCDEFKTFWNDPKVHRQCREAADGEGLFNDMSDSPELQMVVGTKVLNYLLNYAEETLKARGGRLVRGPSGKRKRVRGFTESQVVENALKMWFGKADCVPRMVRQCEECLQAKGSDVEKCLGLTGGNCR